MSGARVRRGGSSLAAAMLVLLAGCSVVPTQPPAPHSYDLGPAVVASTEAAPLRLGGCTAPVWLDGTAMYYRLEWRDPLQLQAYRDSRWLAPPCALLAGQLRASLPPGDAATARSLNLELDAFEQDFAAADTSRVVIRLRATLGVPGGAPAVRSQSFSVNHPAASADAVGGVAALAAATRELLAALQAWAAQP